MGTAAGSVPTRDTTILRIAEGGMGTVELVARNDGRFSRLFARKRLHPHLRLDSAFRSMFLDEARLAGLIRHPNVTAVWEVGQDDEGPFLLMDYVDGVSVAHILESTAPGDQALPLAFCVSVISQAARGLHAAHQLVAADGTLLGVVHRDISPKNLLVGYDGLVRVVDFGIAKAKDNTEQTRAGVLKGNIGYMAPEYLRFENIDHRSDLFALGVVLYELLARERLYGGDDTPAIARSILEDPPPDVFEVRDVPPELASLLFDLLAKDRALRPASALDVATRLDEILVNLTAIDGPFDMAAFLEEGFGTERRERDAAINAGLARARSTDTQTRPAERAPVAMVSPRGWRSTAHRFWPVGLAVAAAVAVAVAVPLSRRLGKGGRPGIAFTTADAGLWSGGWHNCAIRDRVLLCWGSNIRGQVGDGTTQNRETPVPVQQLGPVRAAALGEYHSCALTTGGGISCWGRNVRGEIGRSAPTLSKLPLPVEGLTGATSLAAGRQHTCARMSPGTVVCWGANESGQLGRPPSQEGQAPAEVPNLPPAEKIFAGGANTCAILLGGEVRCWGANESDQLGDATHTPRATPAPVPGLKDVVSLAMGNSAKAGSKSPDLTKSGGFICALTRKGAVLCWGSNYTGQLGDGTRQDRETPTQVRGISDAIQIAVGDMHACVLHGSGRVSCWGRNEFGAVGDGTMGPATIRLEAVDVVGVQDAVGLALGGAHSCARRRTGGVHCWGVNNFGQLGDGTVTLRPSPSTAGALP